MAVITKADLLKKFGEIVGDDNSDRNLEFLGDLQDTFDDLESKSQSDVDWKAKYEENDKNWRQKYRDRFMSGTPEDNKLENNGTQPDGSEGENEPQLKTSFEELFS